MTNCQAPKLVGGSNKAKFNTETCPSEEDNIAFATVNYFDHVHLTPRRSIEEETSFCMKRPSLHHISPLRLAYTPVIIKSQNCYFAKMTTRGKSLRQEKVPGLLALLRKHQRHIKKWDRWAPDFALVARLSHRGTSLLRRVWDECQDGSPLQPPKKTGPAQRPEHTPEALAGKLMWLTPEQIASIAYTLNAVGLTRTTYNRLKPKAMELLRRIPQTRFHKADSDQQSRMLDHIRAASPGDCICVALYAFTLKSFSDALIERKCAGVEVLVLVDLTWLKAHCEALDVLCDLQAAGIEVKHLGDTSMNLTLLVVGGAYAAGGSASLTDTAFASNAELVTEVQGYNEGVASARELFDEHYNCDEARGVRSQRILRVLQRKISCRLQLLLFVTNCFLVSV